MTDTPAPPIVFLHGERIYLRPVEMSDMPRVHCWINDPETWVNLLNYIPLNEAAERKWYEGILEKKDSVSFAIVAREGDRHIGGMGLHNIHPRNRSALFGIFIGDKEYRGKGYGTEATRLILKYAFETLNLHRVELGVYDFNAVGIAVYEKCGFVLEGTMREQTFQNGKYVDHLMYSILDREYFARG